MFQRNNFLSSDSAFTLIELLIAMAVASIMMAAMASAYWIQTQTSREQQMVVGMQQSMRAAIYMLERDIKMAGYDEDNNNPPGATILTADDDEFSFEFVDDTNTVVTVGYSLYDALGDGDDDIGRSVDGAPRAAIAENIEEMEFFYTLADGTQSIDPTAAPLSADPEDIRAVGISILARTSAETRSRDNAIYLPLSNVQDGTQWGPFNDGFNRQIVTATIMCRNMTDE